MDDVITFWLDKGVSGFRVDAVNHLFEDPELKDEPLSGKTQDKYSHQYTEHIYTKDLASFTSTANTFNFAIMDVFPILIIYSLKYMTCCITGALCWRNTPANMVDQLE